MALKTLKPSLGVLNTNRIKVLDTKPGATERIRGRAWMQERNTALVAGLFTCVDCGHVSASNEVDHQIPLEKGGKNEQSNYRIRCIECHRAKTDAENRARHGKG